MSFALHILIHTPPWIFVLLAYLIWQGIQSLKPRTVPVWRLVVVPVAFITLGLSMLAMRHGGESTILAWLAAAVFLAPLGFASGPRLIAVDPSSRMVTRPGSALPLIRNLVVFALQYMVAVLAALDTNRHPALLVVSCAVSGANAGYFLGWSIALRQHYRTAPRNELRPA